MEKIVKKGERRKKSYLSEREREYNTTGKIRFPVVIHEFHLKYMVWLKSIV